MFPMVSSELLAWSCKAVFVVVFWSVAVLVLMLPAWMLLLWLFSPWLLLINLFCTLLMAHGGYLHLTRASLRCNNSFWSNSGLVQTVLALWLSVPMTPYLADKLWWLSNCKYWSVWVGLQYTVKDKELSASGVTKVSRMGMPPLSWNTFYCKLNCWINATDVLQKFLFMGLLLDDPSVILIPKPRGLEADQRVSLSKCSIYRLANIGLAGEPTATPSTCSQNLFWNEKYVLCRQNPKRSMMFCNDTTVLSCKFSSFSNRSLIILRSCSVQENNLAKS